MLLRFLLALIAATFAVPANAGPVCHEAPPAATISHHGQPAHHQPQKPMAVEEQHCLGCIAPATIRAPQVARPLMLARIDDHGEPLLGATRAASPPATPPPRSDA